MYFSVNFCKYVPPKFDTSNSAVYRLIQENEARCKGIAGRPEKVLAEEDYCAPVSSLLISDFLSYFSLQLLLAQDSEKIGCCIKLCTRSPSPRSKYSNFTAFYFQISFSSKMKRSSVGIGLLNTEYDRTVILGFLKTSSCSRWWPYINFTYLSAYLLLSVKLQYY